MKIAMKISLSYVLLLTANATLLAQDVSLLRDKMRARERFSYKRGR